MFRIAALIEATCSGAPICGIGFKPGPGRAAALDQRPKDQHEIHAEQTAEADAKARKDAKPRDAAGDVRQKLPGEHDRLSHAVKNADRTSIGLLSCRPVFQWRYPPELGYRRCMQEPIHHLSD